jgi:ATP-dependent DNA helicase RecG
VAASPAELAIQAVVRPLAFAAREDFAHLDRVRDLPASVAGAADRALVLAIPRDLAAALRAVRDGFAVPLELPALRRAVERALARLAPFASAGYAERALATSPAVLPGLGPKRAEALAKRGLGSVKDLLFLLPSRYDDRRALVTIGALEVGRHATIVGRVLGCGFNTWRGRGPGRAGRLFEAVLGDATGTVNLKWFRGGDAISRIVKKDELLLVTGDVKRYRFSVELRHPEVEVLEAWTPGEAAEAPDAPRRIVPDYTTPEGLHPRALRSALQHAVAEYADLLPPHLPESLVRARALPSPSVALRELHAPSPDADLAALRRGRSPYQERLILEELYLLEVGLALRRARYAREPGIAIEADGPRVRAALRELPFELTGAQLRAWHEICSDLMRPHPMNRLLEGDVGCGKTVVAFLAAVAAAEAGHQTALMAPTELLAEQHYRTLQRLAQAEPEAQLRLEIVTASQSRTHLEAVRAELEAGGIDLAIGTHALLQEGVGFRSLGLVVVDEQHRFGVLQRAALKDKTHAAQPHMLVMTATPIPRTLALTLYGDLDLSVIDELPPGRLPARSLLLRAGEGQRIVSLLRETVSRGEQAYVVYPLIEASEKSDLRAASESCQRIRRAFPEFRVDLVHGRLDAAARNAAMARFESGETQILVSTTLIEVGVDVPNATLMIVEHAERFGLAQLHQLRGRVGRGDKPGACVFVARAVGEDSEARLAVLLASSDGFELAEADLRIRGPGEFLGTRQHGRLPDLRIADLVRDAKLVAVAREAALDTVRRDPELRRAPELARAAVARWGERLALVGIG